MPPGTIYQSLYNAIAPEVSGFTTSVDQSCPNPGNSTEVFAEDNAANSNTIFTWLPNKSAAEVTASVTNAIDYAQSMQQMMGIQGVTIDISYPMLVNNSANLPNSNFTTQNYSAYLNYYQRVVSGIQALGMKVNVETNIIFPSLLTPPQTPAQYYNGLTETMLENGVAEVAQHVINDIKPNDIDLATEPSTIDYNTGLSGIDTPSGFASYVAAIQAQISTTGSSTVEGAGSDDWETYNFLCRPADQRSVLPALRYSYLPARFSSNQCDSVSANSKVNGCTHIRHGELDRQRISICRSHDYRSVDHD